LQEAAYWELRMMALGFYGKDPDMVGKSFSLEVDLKPNQVILKDANEKGATIEETWNKK
jgi:hypothetical protein